MNNQIISFLLALASILFVGNPFETGFLIPDQDNRNCAGQATPINNVDIAVDWPEEDNVVGRAINFKARLVSGSAPEFSTWCWEIDGQLLNVDKHNTSEITYTFAEPSSGLWVCATVLNANRQSLGWDCLDFSVRGNVPAPAPEPDLVIRSTGVPGLASVCSSSNINFVVENIGDTESPSSSVTIRPEAEFRFSGQSNPQTLPEFVLGDTEKPVRSLAPGESASISFQVADWVLEDQNVSFVVTVDLQNTINEKREDNNTATTESISVRDEGELSFKGFLGPSQAKPLETVQFSAIGTNHTGKPLTVTVELTIDGFVKARKTVTFEPCEPLRVPYATEFSDVDLGNHLVRIGQRNASTVHDNIEIIQRPSLLAQFGWSPVDAVTGRPVEFFDRTSTGSPNEWVVERHWTIDEADVSSAGSFPRTFNQAGDLRVCLFVVTNLRRDDDDCQVVAVLPSDPTVNVDFDWAPRLPQVGDAIRFNNRTAMRPGERIESLNWTLGDGAEANQVSSIYTYAIAKDYQVCLFIETNYGRGNDCEFVTVAPIIDVRFRAKPINNRNPLSMEFTDISRVEGYENDAYARRWTFGNEGALTTANDSTIFTFKQRSKHLVCLRIGTKQHCENLTIGPEKSILDELWLPAVIAGGSAVAIDLWQRGCRFYNLFCNPNDGFSPKINPDNITTSNPAPGVLVAYPLDQLLVRMPTHIKLGQARSFFKNQDGRVIGYYPRVSTYLVKFDKINEIKKTPGQDVDASKRRMLDDIQNSLQAALRDNYAEDFHNTENLDDPGNTVWVIKNYLGALNEHDDNHAHMDNLTEPLRALNDIKYQTACHLAHSYYYGTDTHLSQATPARIVDIHVGIVDSGIEETHKEFDGISIMKFSLTNDQGKIRLPHGTEVVSLVVAENGQSEFNGILSCLTNHFLVKAYKVAAYEESSTAVPLSSSLEAVRKIYDQSQPFFLASLLGQKPARLVINISMGWHLGNVAPKEMTEVYQLWEAYMASFDVEEGAKDVVFVTSAGNTREELAKGDKLHAPGGIPLVNNITVGAANAAVNAVWSNSDTVGSNFGDEVDLYAPGEGVRTLDVDDPDGQESRDGTSFSAPLVTSTIALMLALHPKMDAEEIHQVLTQEMPLKNLGLSNPVPFLDACKAVIEAIKAKEAQLDGKDAASDRQLVPIKDLSCNG